MLGLEGLLARRNCGGKGPAKSGLFSKGAYAADLIPRPVGLCDAVAGETGVNGRNPLSPRELKESHGCGKQRLRNTSASWYWCAPLVVSCRCG